MKELTLKRTFTFVTVIIVSAILCAGVSVFSELTDLRLLGLSAVVTLNLLVGCRMYSICKGRSFETAVLALMIISLIGGFCILVPLVFICGFHVPSYIHFLGLFLFIPGVLTLSLSHKMVKALLLKLISVKEGLMEE